MIFPANKVQGFIDIMKSLEIINEELFNEYISLYGAKIEETSPSHCVFVETQNQVSQAVNAVAALLSDILIRKE